MRVAPGWQPAELPHSYDEQGICMKVAILARGLGSRLSEETGVRPKPMVEVPLGRIGSWVALNSVVEDSGRCLEQGAGN
jgi:hypothetical protein